MKRNVKKMICMIFAIGMIIAQGVPTLAYGQPFRFEVQKNGAVKKSGIVYKEDSEACSYVTVESVMWSTRDPWVFGARVRNSSGLALTSYYTTSTTGAMGYPGLPFLSGAPAYAGMPCQLNAQVDSSSAATIITARGVWLP